MTNITPGDIIYCVLIGVIMFALAHEMMNK